MLSLGSSCSRLAELLSRTKVWRAALSKTEMKTQDQDQETFGSGIRDHGNELTAKTKLSLDNLLTFVSCVATSPALLVSELHEHIVRRFPGHRYEDEEENEVWVCHCMSSSHPNQESVESHNGV